MCNPGKVNAALCAQAMIMKYNPEIIINSGVAGSLSDDLDVLSVAVGSACVQHDFDLSPLGMPKGMVDGVNIIEFECDKRACEILEKVTSKYNTKIGTIATGDVFVSGNDAKSKIAKDFGAIACEMEGGAIAHVCMENNTKCAALRTFSDGANEMDFNTFKVKAADMAIEIIDNFIKEY